MRKFRGSSLLKYVEITDWL